MTAAVGFPTLRLVRVAMGSLTLGDLSPGSWRDLRKDELDALRRQATIHKKKGGPGPDRPTQKNVAFLIPPISVVVPRTQRAQRSKVTPQNISCTAIHWIVIHQILHIFNGLIQLAFIEVAPARTLLELSKVAESVIVPFPFAVGVSAADPRDALHVLYRRFYWSDAALSVRSGVLRV
jgi:hypothetical protein